MSCFKWVTRRTGFICVLSVLPLLGCGTEPENSSAVHESMDSQVSIAPAQVSFASAKEWHRTISKVPLPKTGCVHASMPDMTWTEVACAAPRGLLHLPPDRAPGQDLSDTVGAGTTSEYSLTSTSSPITIAEGSFPVVSGVTSGGNYTLQVNTNYFNPSLGNPCGQSPNPACKVWQQFVYVSNGYIQIQYWLLDFNSTHCPTGWSSYVTSLGVDDCYILGPETPAPYVAPKEPGQRELFRARRPVPSDRPPTR